MTQNRLGRERHECKFDASAINFAWLRQRQLLNWRHVARRCERYGHGIVGIQATRLGACFEVWASSRSALNLVSLLAGSELDPVRALPSGVLIDAKRFLKRPRGCKRAPKHHRVLDRDAGALT